MVLRDDLTERRLTPEQWVTDGKVKGKIREPSKATQNLRRGFLDVYAQANGRPIDEVIASIETTTQLYDSAKNLVNYCRARGFKVGTVAEYRSMIPGFFSDVFGSSFVKKVFEEQVPSIQSTVTTSKAFFSRDVLVRALKAAGPRDKALLYLLSYGFRINEALSRRMEDIEDKGTHAIVKLWADETKTRELRRQFISKECMDIIRTYHSLLPESQKGSKWLFPGEKTHLVRSPALGNSFKKLFKAVGLEDTPREIVSPHGLRAFAEDQMRACGLSDTYTKQIVGHDTGTEENYKRWVAIEEEWVKKCLDRMSWLRPTEVIVTKYEKDPRTDKLVHIVKLLLKVRQKEVEGDLPPEVETFLLEDTKELEDKSEEDR